MPARRADRRAARAGVVGVRVRRPRRTRLAGRDARRPGHHRVGQPRGVVRAHHRRRIPGGGRRSDLQQRGRRRPERSARRLPQGTPLGQRERRIRPRRRPAAGGGHRPWPHRRDDLLRRRVSRVGARGGAGGCRPAVRAGELAAAPAAGRRAADRDGAGAGRCGNEPDADRGVRPRRAPSAVRTGSAAASSSTPTATRSRSPSTASRGSSPPTSTSPSRGSSGSTRTTTCTATGASISTAAPRYWTDGGAAVIAAPTRAPGCPAADRGRAAVRRR